MVFLIFFFFFKEKSYKIEGTLQFEDLDKAVL